MEFVILFLIGLLIIIIYNILNYFETQLLQSENKKVKILVKDSILILLSSLFSLWIYTKYEKYFIDFFSIIMNKTSQEIGNVIINNKVNDIPVFTDLPNF